ncbi:6-hydroxymethylpterin diphosphokinase MptE-like protein [Lederbergia citri]|nr:6-hydroxymethylpterin diphosphokinase MptE-like protein [Lederbergia citri]
MMALKDIIKRYKFAIILIRAIRRIQFIIFPYIFSVISFNIKKILRVSRIYKNSSYEKLRSIKGKHKGERCFIVATGPSLTIQDLEKLKGEITFSMNSICLAFDETEWRPTYYGIQGIHVFNQLKDHVTKLDVQGKFIGDTISWPKINQNDYIYPLNLLNHSQTHKKYKTQFSDNAFSVVYDGYSITYSLIQIAVYMGFKEIYLLGVDCKYPKDMNHHFKEYGHVDPTFLSAVEKMINAYKVAKKFADSHNIKIYNATRGGMLEVFERVNLETVLEKNTKLLKKSV